MFCMYVYSRAARAESSDQITRELQPQGQTCWRCQWYDSCGSHSVSNQSGQSGEFVLLNSEILSNWVIFLDEFNPHLYWQRTLLLCFRTLQIRFWTPVDGCNWWVNQWLCVCCDARFAGLPCVCTWTLPVGRSMLGTGGGSSWNWLVNKGSLSEDRITEAISSGHRGLGQEGGHLNISTKTMLRQTTNSASKPRLRNLYFRQKWKDSRLKWDASEYGNIGLIAFFPTDIWIPNFALENR